MPAPASSLATLRPELGTFMQFDLEATRQGFIGFQVLPMLRVAVQAGAFGVLSVKNLLQSRDTKRAPGSGYNRQKYKFDDDSFACQEYGAEEPVDDRQAKMYANYFQVESFAAIRARDVVLREAERRVAAMIFNNSTWTETDVTNEWDDTANATPIADVEAAVQRLYAKGIKANTLIVPWTVYRNLRQCDDILSTIAAAGAGDKIEASKITPQKLAEVFDLDKVLVGDGQYNSANEGQDASIAAVWGTEYAAVCRVAETQDVSEPCVGRTFHWVEDGSEEDAMVESYRDESIRGDVIRARFDVDEKVIYSDALELLGNITT